MNSTLVSTFARLRNWNPEILLKQFEVKALKAMTRVLNKVFLKLRRLRKFLSNPPP